MKSKMNYSRGAKAFTLIELFVLLAVLIVLVVPVLLAICYKSRERIMVAQCATNLRQLSSAAQFYAADNRDFLPPTLTSVAWPWDLTSSVSQSFISYGLQKRNFYCPSTAPAYTDKENFLAPYPSSLWNFAFPPSATEGDPSFWHITGYAFAFGGSGSTLNVRYRNAKIITESHQTGTTAFYDSPASRVLMADVIISTSSFYPASAIQPFQGIPGGFHKPHLSAHLAGGGVPNGANLSYKDGHVQWKKFNSPPAGFSVPTSSPWLSTEDTYTMVRTASPQSPYFWW